MDAREDDLLRSLSPARAGLRVRSAVPLGLVALLVDVGCVGFAVLLLALVLPHAHMAPSWPAFAALACLAVVGAGGLTRSYSRSMLLHPRMEILVLNGLAPLPLALLTLASAPEPASAQAWPLAILAVLVPAAALAGREALALSLAAACRTGLLPRDRVALVAGSHDAAGPLARRLRAEPDCADVRVVLAEEVLLRTWKAEEADRVVVRAAGLPATAVEALRDTLRAWPGPVDFVGSPSSVPSALPHAAERGHLPVFARKRASLTRGERAAKRGLDVVVSSLAMLVLSPLLVTLAVLLQVRGGPALVRLGREDFRGRRLAVYAFAAVGDDDLGDALQRTGLGQLPALLNVLTGDLALVGPAPLDRGASAEQRAAADYADRQGLRPGLAQPFADGWRDSPGGRSPGTWTLAALAYCDEWSLGLDLVVLAGALGRLCTPHGKAWA
jgi:lipopolysaccharide/colanic/teichoic acid biosynthesis glycosyltransferase